MIKQRDLNRLAKKISRANDALWNAVCLVEEVLGDEAWKVIEEQKNTEQYIKLIRRLAMNYDKLNKKYDSFADAGIHQANFDEFDQLTSQISEVIEG